MLVEHIIVTTRASELGRTALRTHRGSQESLRGLFDGWNLVHRWHPPRLSHVVTP